jgi:hypothetical protein
MSIPDIVTALIQERDRLDRAIEVLGGTTGVRTKAVKSTASVNGASARRPMSSAARKAASERMRRYWAAKRKKGASVGVASKKS